MFQFCKMKNLRRPVRPGGFPILQSFQYVTGAETSRETGSAACWTFRVQSSEDKTIVVIQVLQRLLTDTVQCADVVVVSVAGKVDGEQRVAV